MGMYAHHIILFAFVLSLYPSVCYVDGCDSRILPSSASSQPYECLQEYDVALTSILYSLQTN
jgi:hypothetical protein